LSFSYIVEYPEIEKSKRIVSPCKYKNDIVVSSNCSKKLFTYTPEKQTEQVAQSIPQNIESIHIDKVFEISELVVDYPTPTLLDKNILAIKFRYKWYFRKFHLSVRKHKNIYQTWGIFKRLTIGVIKEIEQQKRYRYLVLQSKTAKLFNVWKVSSSKFPNQI